MSEEEKQDDKGRGGAGGRGGDDPLGLRRRRGGKKRAPSFVLEPGFKFDQHVFKQGEYVSLREQDGSLRTFRVVSVKPSVAP